MIVPIHWDLLTFSRRLAEHYADRTGAKLDQKSVKGIPTTTLVGRGILEMMGKGVLLELFSYNQVRQSCGRKARFGVGDVAILLEDMRCRHMWESGRIEVLQTGRYGKTSTVILHTNDGDCLAHPFQLVITLEVGQGGEDVEDDKLYSSHVVCIALAVLGIKMVKKCNVFLY